MIDLLELVLFPLGAVLYAWLLDPTLSTLSSWSLMLSGLLSGIVSFLL